MSNQLRDDSKKYRKDAKNLNLMALYQKYGPIGVVVLLVAFVRMDREKGDREREGEREKGRWIV